MEMLALDDLAFNFVNNKGFRRLMHFVEPRYKIPDEEHFRTRMLQDVYAAVRKEIEKVLATACNISFTTDT